MIAVLHVDTPQDAKLACEIAYTRPDHQEEDFTYCVLRERGMELKQLREAGLPYALVCGKSIDKLHLLSHNLPDELTIGALLDMPWRYRGPLNDVFIKQVQPTESYYQQILRWPQWCRAEFLLRSVRLTDFVDFVESSRRDPWSSDLFIKTVHKGEPSRAFRLVGVFEHENFVRRSKLPQEKPDALSYATKRPCPEDGFIQDNPQPYFNEYHGEMEQRAPSWYAMSGELILSEPLDIHKDEHGTLEYRCFVVGHQVTSISRYLDYVTPEIPEQAHELAGRVARACMSMEEQGPGPDYVVDIAQTSRGWVVIEFNPLPCSGRYYGNSAAALFDELLTGCPRVDGTDTPPALTEPPVHIMLLDDDPILQLRQAMAFARGDANGDEEEWLDI